MLRRKCNALLRVAYTLNYIQRAGQPNIRARLMPEHNFGWTHTCRIMVLSGLLWQKLQQGAQLVFELDSVFWLPQDLSPIVHKIPYSVSETLQYILSHIASPILFCIHGQTKKMLPFILSAYLVGREEQGNRCVINTTNYFTVQDQYLEVRQLFRPWWTVQLDEGKQTVWFTPTREQFFTTWCKSIWERAQLHILSQCLSCHVQNMHAEGPDHFTLSLFHLSRHSVKRTPAFF